MIHQKLGVVLIDNLDLALSFSDIYQFFSRVIGVTFDFLLHTEDPGRMLRFCWVIVENTIETVGRLTPLSIR